MNPQNSSDRLTIPVADCLKHAYAPRSVGFVEIHFSKGTKPEIYEGKLQKEVDVRSWLKKEEAQVIAVKSRFRLLYGHGYITSGRDDLNLPFTPKLFQTIKEDFKLPAEFDRILEQEATRCVRNTIDDQQGNAKGLNICIKYFSWWLATIGLGLSYDHDTKTTYALLLSNDCFQDEEATVIGELIRLIKLHCGKCQQPYFLPLLICDLFTQAHATEIHKATKKVFGLERSIGMHDYPAGRHPSGTEDDEDFSITSRKLNGQLSRLANFEKWVTSQINFLKTVLSYEELSDAKRPTSNLTCVKESREYAIQLLDWNVDLLAQASCQIKIVQAQIQTVYTLLAQRDNKLNIAIAAASKRDSAAMKAIAVVTMVFLPGAYIATLFSMNMFDWRAQRVSEVVSGHFWVYWATTIPVTGLVLSVWAIWSKPWRQ